MDARALCMALLAAESEAEVDEIIDRTPEMQDSDNWLPLDQQDMNFNVVTNQAKSGGKAATELMTNMVDAILTKYAYQAGIDPKGPEAPRTMHEAVKKFVKPSFHPLIKADKNDLRDYAKENLIIGITGKITGGRPCYTFADNGEGQAAEDFEKSFLSLSTGNKKYIPFVQGKYNMGSSGVLNFCGEKWYKLIVSRRYDGTKPWAFTLIRMRPDDDMPVADYFKNGGKHGAIAAFEEDFIFPLHTKAKEEYKDCKLSTGTVVKLYDFHIGDKHRGLRGARDAFNENLADSVLPFRILDCRHDPDPLRGGDRALGVDPRPFYGMERLLLSEHAAEEIDDGSDGASEKAAPAGERKDTVAVIEHPKLGRIEIAAIPLKPGKPEWLRTERSRNRIFHSVNGQVQYKQPRGDLTRMGFSALADRVVILVDASGLKDGAHKGIWKGDRESIIENAVGEMYLSTIKTALEDSKALKELNRKIAREELTQATKEQGRELFQQLVNQDPQVAELLGGDNPELTLPIGSGPEDESQYPGKYSPTIFEIDAKQKLKGVHIPMNRSQIIIGKTDAENGYLTRAENKGQVSILNEGFNEKFTHSSSLSNGVLMLTCKPIKGLAALDDEFNLEISLQDSAMAAPLTDTVTVRVVAPTKGKERKKGKKKKKTKDTSKPTLSLPPVIYLTKDGADFGKRKCKPWPAGMADTDGGDIEDMKEEGIVYKINLDNRYHLRYLSTAKNDIEREAVTEKYIAGMRLVMLGLQHAFSEGEKKLLKEGQGNWLADYSKEIRRIASRGAASTVLALAEHLPKIWDAQKEKPK